MRMWMVSPKIMCVQHLIGEYREILMLVGTLRLKKSIAGYVKNGLIEIKNMIPRHNELREEMINRNYKPKIIIVESDLVLDYLTEEQLNCYVDREKSLNDLLYHSRREKMDVLDVKKG